MYPTKGRRRSGKCDIRDLNITHLDLSKCNKYIKYLPITITSLIRGKHTRLSQIKKLINLKELQIYRMNSYTYDLIIKLSNNNPFNLITSELGIILFLYYNKINNNNISNINISINNSICMCGLNKNKINISNNKILHITNYKKYISMFKLEYIYNYKCYECSYDKCDECDYLNRNIDLNTYMYEFNECYKCIEKAYNYYYKNYYADIYYCLHTNTEIDARYENHCEYCYKNQYCNDKYIERDIIYKKKKYKNKNIK